MNKRLNVIIVEDEPIMRNGIINFIDWESLNCSILADFKDCCSAQKYISDNSENIDIVISDICMQGLTGLDLAEFIHENHSHISIIILTGHADFEYARRSVQLSVSDFITKVNPLEDIPISINKIRKKIQKQKEEYNKIILLEKNAKENLISLQHKLIQDVSRRIISQPDILEKNLEKCRLKIDNYFLLYFHIKLSKQNPNNTVGNSKFNILFDILKQLFGKENNHIVKMSSTSICVISSFCNYDEETNYCCIKKDLNNACTSIKQLINLPVIIGLSCLHENANSLSDACLEAETAIYNIKAKVPDFDNLYYYGFVLPVKKSTQNLTVQIIKYIEDNYFLQELSLNHIAKHFSFSPVYISRIFHKQTDKKLVDYINSVRIEHARRLLLEDDVYLREIANSVGYNNSSYFSKVFKEHYKHSPLEYRNIFKEFK